MRSSVSEPLIPLNAANLRIIPHVHKYFTPFLQKLCKLIHYQTRSCRVRAIKCESPAAVPDAYADEQIKRQL